MNKGCCETSINQIFMFCFFERFHLPDPSCTKIHNKKYVLKIYNITSLLIIMTHLYRCRLQECFGIQTSSLHKVKKIRDEKLCLSGNLLRERHILQYICISYLENKMHVSCGVSISKK